MNQDKTTKWIIENRLVDDNTIDNPDELWRPVSVCEQREKELIDEIKELEDECMCSAKNLLACSIEKEQAIKQERENRIILLKEKLEKEVKQ